MKNYLGVNGKPVYGLFCICDDLAGALKFLKNQNKIYAET